MIYNDSKNVVLVLGAQGNLGSQIVQELKESEKRKNKRNGMLQKMYTFIIQRGYMGSLIMLTGLAIMSFMDIKRRAVPVYMIIVMSILAIGIKIAE